MQTILNWLKRAFQTVIDTLTSLVQGIVDVIYKVLDWAWETVKKCGQAVWDFFFEEEKGLIWQCMDWLCDWVEYFLDQFPDFGEVVQEYKGAADVVMGHIGPLNMFFPIQETIYLIGTFLTFVVLYLGVKFLLKLLPGVG